MFDLYFLNKTNCLLLFENNILNILLFINYYKKLQGCYISGKPDKSHK